MKKALLAAAALFCAATAANASVIPTLTSVTPNGSNFTWSYEGTLAGDAGLSFGDGSRLVIFDFGGYVDGTVFSPYANVAATAELLSDTSDLLLPPSAFDDPGKYNLVFSWIGPDFHTSGGPFSETSFSGLKADSIFSGLSKDLFAAVTVKNNGPTTGDPIWDAGTVSVPAPVPEPATWAMMIMGAGALGAVIRRRRAGAVLAA